MENASIAVLQAELHNPLTACFSKLLLL